MIVAIHQPQYLPWLGYFDKIDMADAFCYLDTVQFKKNEWQNRNRIKTAESWQWLTVPVQFSFPERIDSVGVEPGGKWKKKHLNALVTNYAKAPFFGDHLPFFEGYYNKDWDRLSELNICGIEYLKDQMGLKGKKSVRASEMGEMSDDPTDRLIDICKALGGDTYLSGQDGARYMNLERFRERGVRVIFQDFHHPTYPQRFSDFISHLSALDLLFNWGPESLGILRGQRKVP